MNVVCRELNVTARLPLQPHDMLCAVAVDAAWRARAVMEEKSEPEVVAELYEHVAWLPIERQLRVLEFVWLNAASHARTALLGNANGFALERERQLASLERMALVVRTDESGL